MKQFFRDISPRRALADFAQVWRGENRHRWGVLGVALALTFSLLMLFVPGGGRAPPERPELTWITTFDPARTRAQIIVGNCANEELKTQLEARLAEREELRRELYKTLGEATFVDVEDLEREAAADEARREAAAQAARPDAAALPAGAQLSVEEYCAQAEQSARG